MRLQFENFISKKLILKTAFCDSNTLIFQDRNSFKTIFT